MKNTPISSFHEKQEEEVESICIWAKFNLKKEFSKVSERQKDEFTVVAVIINAWVSEVEAWNLLIYINLSPRQTLVIYVLK